MVATTRANEILIATLAGYGVQAGPKLTGGTVFYVDSGHGDAVDVVGGGNAWSTPFATIDFAIGQCTASAGDVIYVNSGHTEAVTATALLAVDIAGVSIIGVGNGAVRPIITLGAASAIVDVDATSVLLRNLIFKPSGYNTAILIDVDGANCVIDNCYFDMDIGSYEAEVGVDIGATGTSCTVKDCQFVSVGSAGAKAGVKLSGATSLARIVDCDIIGDFSEAGIWNPTGNIATDILIADCNIRNTATGDPALELVSACTGLISNNRLYSDTVGSVLDPGSCHCQGNLGSTAADEAGTTIPTATGDDFGRRVVLSSQMALDGNNIADVFTVAGGPVELIGLIMHITEAVSAHACAISWHNDVTVGAADTPICGAIDINAFAIADDIYITGDGTDAAIKADAATQGTLMCATPAILFAGGIDYVAANANPTSGIADVYLIYRPLVAGATVTAA